MKLLEQFKMLPKQVKLEIVLNAQIFSFIYVLFDNSESIGGYLHLMFSASLLLAGWGLFMMNIIKKNMQQWRSRLSLVVASAAFAYYTICVIELEGTV